MALNFPNSPVNGQEYTGPNNLVYRYDGEKWVTVGSYQANGGFLPIAGGDLTGTLSAPQIGIGTASPASELHLQDSGSCYLTVEGGASSNTGILFGDSADRDIGQILYDNSTDSLEFVANSSERMRIDSSGNVGIGTPAPLAKVEIAVGDVAPASSGSMDTGVVIESGSGSRALNIGSNNTAGYSWINAAFANNSSIADNLVLMTGADERARIDNAGRLLIGTSAPKSAVGFPHLVQIEGTASTTSSLSITRSDGTIGGTLTLAKANGGLGQNGAVANGNVLGQILFNGSNGTNRNNFSARINAKAAEDFTTTACGAYLTFDTCSAGNTAPTERMRIDSSGNVGIGTTSPNCELHVGNPSGNPSIEISRGAVGAEHGYRLFGADGEGNVALKFLPVDNGSVGSETMRIDGSGNVGIGVATLASSSRLTLLESAGNGQTLEIKGANSGGPGSQPGIRFTAFNGDNIGGIYADTNADHVILQTGGSSRLRITSNGNVQIPANASTGTNRLQLGANQQFEILQDAANGFLANDDLVIANKALSENVARFKANGAVTLYHNNAQKFDTTANGINISGGVEFNSGGANNRLDDYEEGTFTPDITSGITSPVYSARGGNYTKVGNLVTYTLSMTVTGGTNNSSQIVISGMPFLSSNSAQAGGGTLAYMNGIAASPAINPTVYIGGNVSEIRLYNTAGNAWLGNSGNGIVGRGFNIIGHYYTDQ